MFPSSPSLDQLHPASVDPGERQWKWNGFAWDAISAVSSLYVGTTDITFNTSPAARHLTGILSIDGLSASATKLETARTLTIGATGKAFDGTTNLTWTTEEIGAGGGLSWVSAGSNATMESGKGYLATADINLTIPASLSPGDQFVVHSVNNTVTVISNGHTISWVGVGNNLVLGPGESVFLVARTSSILDIV